MTGPEDGQTTCKCYSENLERRQPSKGRGHPHTPGGRESLQRHKRAQVFYKATADTTEGSVDFQGASKGAWKAGKT